MKIKTYQLTLAILVSILGAGIGSAVLAYKLGAEAIKGVSSPDVNPSKKFSTSASQTARPQAFKPVNEKQIIKKVETYIQNQKTKSKAKNEPKKETEPVSSLEKTEATASKNQDLTFNFPLKVQDKKMTLEITKASYQGDSLIFDISLKNEGNQTIQFLYSFLEVQDNQGQILSAITEGLPSEIPANGETFKGTVEIPIALIEKNSKLISLKLTDYPEQKLKLDISNIPISSSEQAIAN
ncbi:hypothetical protein [Chroococcus sp. FPU101]|uniref:hypothetical protein n=1 Tax=Chroococcus sp. FPU101 TaxID=1974212 RepID=UPI001A8C16A1|nr:hypothetical protein [Chroococcus sp. FPU101]GFE70488.1 hypothetical protein CFPU101_30980 [Chroococcus sp. FPU101]